MKMIEINIIVIIELNNIATMMIIIMMKIALMKSNVMIMIMIMMKTDNIDYMRKSL